MSVERAINMVQLMENALAKLAFAMIEENAGPQVSREYAMRFLDEAILQSAQSAHYVEIYGDNVQFYNQSLQEYLAAVELKSVGLSHVLFPTEYENAGFSFSNPIEKKWDRVIQVFAGIERKDAVIREIQQYDPVLAASIIGSGINVSDALIDELIADQIERLGDEVANLKMGAVTALRYLGKITTPSLIEVLKKSDNPYARAGAALVLEKTADAAATSVLISRLTDTQPAWLFGVMVCDYVENALKAIDSLEAKEAVKNWADMLLPHLDSEDVHVRARAALKLGRIRNSIAVPKLIDLLNDENYTVNFVHNERICDYAVEALEEIGTSEATRAAEEWRRQEKSKK